jgi:hypothetical protein|tara:strand:+ start:543 stop:677 length:135 start_codon:yes stop_codon:yes gene_type:complete
MKNLTILILPLFLMACGSSRIMLNADIPQDTEITIEISTDNTTE